MTNFARPRFILATLMLSALFIPAGANAHSDTCRTNNAFTIAVISDTQNYVDETHAQPDGLAIFEQQTRFLASHKRQLNLAFATHVGDVVQHGDGTNGTPADTTWGAGTEWDRALEAMLILADAGLPFGMSPGNHDYDNYSYSESYQPLTSDTMWKSYFGSHSPLFKGKPWYGGASDKLAYDPGLSSYQVFVAGDKLFLHISLEMEAGDAALAWAQKVIDMHKGDATIITTHEYLNPPADDDNSPPLQVPAERIAASTRYLNGSPGGWNGAEEVWEKFISKNDQVFLVLCGHAWGETVNGVSKSENIRIDKNNAGHPVYQILTDYQGNKKSTGIGGDGWLRLMEFDLQKKAIHFITYSPTLNKYAGRNGESTFNQAPEFSDFVLPMPVQVLRARPDRRPGNHWAY
jgi:hypothetical protein